MLLEVVLTLEALAANLAGEGEFGALVGALMDHEVVGLGKAALAVLADKLAFGAHLPSELAPAVLVLYLHDGEHFAGRETAQHQITSKPTPRQRTRQHKPLY